jgi:hypothetical protein
MVEVGEWGGAGGRVLRRGAGVDDVRLERPTLRLSRLRGGGHPSQTFVYIALLRA